MVGRVLKEADMRGVVAPLELPYAPLEPAISSFYIGHKDVQEPGA